MKVDKTSEYGHHASERIPSPSMDPESRASLKLRNLQHLRAEWKRRHFLMTRVKTSTIQYFALKPTWLSESEQYILHTSTLRCKERLMVMMRQPVAQLRCQAIVPNNECRLWNWSATAGTTPTQLSVPCTSREIQCELTNLEADDGYKHVDCTVIGIHSHENWSDILNSRNFTLMKSHDLW